MDTHEVKHTVKKEKLQKEVENREHHFMTFPKLEVAEFELEPELDEIKGRDLSEWQGMRVPRGQPPCAGKESCGLAMACQGGTCGPCTEDGHCGVGERCVLQHCVREEKTSCTTRDDCDEDALCVLSGYSSGFRGNEDMVAFCQDSSELEEQVEEPGERKKFDEIRGPFESSGLEFSDLSKGLHYE